MNKYHFENGTYFNNSKDSRKKHLKNVIKSFWATFLSRFIKRNRLIQFTPEIKDKWLCKVKPVKSSFEPIVTWVGQSTFLIQIGDVNILTDPIFGNVGFGFHRNFEPGISLSDLPKIDYVLISHNHCDHMEHSTIEYLRKDNPIFFVPEGNKKWFTKRKFERVMEFTWGQSKTLLLNFQDSDEIKFNFLPAHHWSTRKIIDMNKTLWGSWLVEFNNFKIYFAGDSAYETHYKKIGEKFKDIDLALLPIGPNEPKKMVIHSHLSTEQACQAFLDLNATSMIPMHWGTFRLCFDDFDEPIKRLTKWWDENKELVENKNLHIVKFGQPVGFKKELEVAEKKILTKSVSV